MLLRICHRSSAVISMVIFALVSSAHLVKADWPQILGPNRDGIAKDETLLSQWPEDGPREVWTYDIGEGYAGPAIKDGRLIIFHTVGQEQFAEALDARTGKPIWKQTMPAKYKGGGIDPDRGSKCVPLIHNQKVYLFDAAGFLRCLDLENGNQVWMRDLVTDFKCPFGYFGTGSTPIVVDEKLLLNVGGRKWAVVAFDLETGKTLWQAFNDRASYSSPNVMTVGEQTIAVFISRMHLIGLNPVDGEVLFSLPFGRRGATVNGAMPVIVDDHIFVNSAYNIGARWVGVSKEKDKFSANVEWSNDTSFSSQYSTPVFYKGYLYGTAGREDQQTGSFRCVKADTGDVEWEQKSFPVGHVILVGDKLIAIDCLGGLHLIEATPEKFNQLATAQVVPGKARSLPALSDGKLYLRSNGSKAKLYCFQVGD